jgi:hypothetical protein
MGTKYRQGRWVGRGGIALAAAVAVLSAGALGGQDAAPKAPARAAADVPAAPTVLLLTNGHVFQGEIVEDATGYYLRHRIGVKQFARRNVAGVFESLEDAYEFQKSRVPKDDPDERMKLALWCMGQKLTEQAREELNAVLALSPENSRAKAMVFFLNSRADGLVDSEVERTGGQADAAIRADSDDAPRQLSRSALDELRDANRQRPASGPPIIFDLPPQIAVRRYQEFGRSVHAELQNHCAKCHDVESHTGSFRLYRARTKRDLANDLVQRANLDAALQLIDREDLARSKLLSAAALTHPPDGRPVLGGPNHPAYRVLKAWVASLTDGTKPAAEATTGVVPARFAPAQPGGAMPRAGDDDDFASGRTGAPTAATAAATGARPVLDNPNPPAVGATPRIVGGDSANGEATSPAVPRDARFPLPDPMQLMRPPGVVAGAPSAAAAPPGARSAAPAGARAPGGKPRIVEMPDGTQAMELPGGELVPFVSSKALKSAVADDAEDPAKKAVAAGAKRKAQLDAAELRKYIEERAKMK